MLPVALAKYEKKSGMILFGSFRHLFSHLGRMILIMLYQDSCYRSWIQRACPGRYASPVVRRVCLAEPWLALYLLASGHKLIMLKDRQDDDQLGFTYVQGMNVLAAPFLYTMPSELEAFFCFSKFIEESCPLYVQPTLEGVHKGLKVR
jgi:hypothetical protein